MTDVVSFPVVLKGTPLENPPKRQFNKVLERQNLRMDPLISAILSECEVVTSHFVHIYKGGPEGWGLEGERVEGTAPEKGLGGT